MPYKTVMVKYKECLKNHASPVGEPARDGCREFMPSGEEGTIEALTCSACNCHRNFHRKEVEGGGGDDHDPQWYNQTAPHNLMSKPGRKFIMGHQIHPKNVNVLGGHEPPLPPPPHHHHGLVYPTAVGRTPPPLHHQMRCPNYRCPASAPASSLSADSGESAETRIQRLISEHRVIIFSRSSCCVCHTMKQLLASVGFNPTVVELEDDEINAIPTPPDAAAGAPPVLFIDGSCVGGLESLVALHLRGHLVPKLEVGAHMPTF